MKIDTGDATLTISCLLFRLGWCLSGLLCHGVSGLDEVYRPQKGIYSNKFCSGITVSFTLLSLSLLFYDEVAGKIESPA